VVVKMTDKQERFCQEYVANGNNATKAAKAAGYSKKTAQRIGSENLSKPVIINRIDELRKPIAEKLKITKELVLQGILDIARNGEQENNRLKAHDMLGKYAGIYEVDNRQGATQIQVHYYSPQKDPDK